jgi:hypothetical protein
MKLTFPPYASRRSIMFIIMPVLAATLLVVLGYFATWSSYKENLPGSIVSFGRVLAIVLFVLGGIVLVTGVAMSARMRMHGMSMMGPMSWEHSMMKEKMMQGMEKGQCGMMEKGGKMEKMENKKEEVK